MRCRIRFSISVFVSSDLGAPRRAAMFLADLRLKMCSTGVKVNAIRAAVLASSIDEDVWDNV